MVKSTGLVLTEKLHGELSVYLEAIAFPALVADQTGAFIAHNALATSMFENREVPLDATFTFQKLVKYITTLDGKPRASAKLKLERLFGKPKPAQEFMLELQREAHTFSYSGSLGQLVKEKKVWGVLIILRDITDELRQRNLQKTFIKVVGHELKQPLGLIKAYTYYLKRLLNVTKFVKEIEYVQKIENQIEIMAQTFNDIVEATRFSLQTFSISPEETDVVSLLIKCVDELRMLHPNRQINLPEIHSIAVKCMVDPVRTQQVFTNILTNAIKYSPETTAIDIDARLGAKKCTIEISDHGQGITASEMKRIFEPYFRSARFNRAGVKGLGLGLSFALNIMIRQGGLVNVKSAPGKGSTFTLSFPLTTQSSSMTHK